MKKLLIIDDHNLIYNGIKNLLEDDFKLHHAINLKTAEDLINEESFHVILIDITLKDESGFDIVPLLASDQHFFFLSMHRTSYFVRKAQSVGANGYFLKDDPVEFIIQNIKKREFDDFIMSKSVESAVTDNMVTSSLTPKYDLLTLREQEIFSLFAKGLSYKEIAFRLNLSSKTINNHRSNIMKKMEINSIPELITEAINMGFGS